jgi:hypothetical protein
MTWKDGAITVFLTGIVGTVIMYLLGVAQF